MFTVDDFPIRLAQLLTRKNVSAREMSLAIGQNAGYIQNIESGKALPSMSSFLYICEYLKITPDQFFDEGNADPARLHSLMEDLKHLDDVQLESIRTLVRGLIKK